MIDALKAAFPAVEWQPDAETGGWCGRDRRTWLYVHDHGAGYQATADLELQGKGWALTPDEAVRLALVDLGVKWRGYAERVVGALGNWGHP